MSKRYKKLAELSMFKRPRFGLSRLTTDILMFSFFAATVATLNNAVMHGMKLESSILAFLSIFALLAGLMLVVSIILRRRNRSTRLLEETFVRAIHQALDQSSLNPHLNKQQHAQHTKQTSTEP